MAYVDKYQAGWHSDQYTGTLTLSEEGYVGSVIDLTLLQDQLTINYSFNDWENPIIGLSCEFSIQNTGADFFDYMELMYAEERKFKVTVETTTGLTLFAGFLNTDTVSQKYLKYQPIKFTASTYLSRLEYFYPSIVDTLATVSFIDIIDNILSQTGAEYDIYVNCSLYSTTSIIYAGQTLFNKSAIYTELFWEDNVERKDSLSTLKSILASFNCYIYWYNNNWYIERYEDIKSGTVSFVKYTTGTSYTYNSAGSVVNIQSAVRVITDLQFIETSQTIHANPGFQKIRILLKDDLLFNAVINDYSNVLDTATGDTAPNPTRREWMKIENSGAPYWTNVGESYSVIANSVKRNFRWVDPTDGPIYSSGLYTKFIMTIEEDTQLTIKWKQIVTVYSDWENYTFNFHWYLRLSGNSAFVYYNDTTELWELKWTDALTGSQTIVLEGTSFNYDTSSGEPSVTIPIGTIASLLGDQTLILCIGQETYYTTDFPDETSFIETWIGDVVVTTSGSFQNNVITGDANTSFLGKKDVEIDVFDAGSFNYKNAVMTGAYYGSRTELWTEDGVNSWSIADWLLRGKFQFWNKTKQEIHGSFKRSTNLKPFRIFLDEKQNDMPFLVLGYSWNVMAGIYKNVVLGEFDTTTDINLV